MRDACHFNIIEIYKNHIYNANSQRSNKQPFFKCGWLDSLPVYSQFVGIIKKYNHRYKTEQHELKWHCITNEQSTNQSQSDNITNNGSNR